MLEEVSYLGHELVNSSFSLKKEPRGKGYYKYNLSIGDKFNFLKRMMMKTNIYITKFRYP
ncbi:hypothetical protein VR7878_03706 [Vibrio ruber DSM 16370]|uniref:Uncharacterized protein n=1 Tax=Vibrio ruber (strain DSM 16370 / JCM 11486 / BCRC 17186 / CECT 7878 / LMG 23124 / VR1) TaxID=1123498 RepID=A0A1R4LTU0_VIBR1|nr:hypothetical protein VR7878_03706 [Vibrio ruber DSM 16370]